MVHPVGLNCYRKGSKKQFSLFQIFQPDAPGDPGAAEEEPSEGEAAASHLHHFQGHGCQMAIARFLDLMCLALRAPRTMAPLRCAAKFDPFLSLDCARVEGRGAQSKERKGSSFAA